LLAADVRSFMEERPANSRRHGLSTEERDRRRVVEAAWEDRGGAILRRVRQVLARRRPSRTDADGRAGVWLIDVVNWFELAVLDRVGVVGGLRRPAWQLECLLRAE